MRDSVDIEPLPTGRRTCAAARIALDALWTTNPSIFRRLFQLERLVRLASATAEPLVAASLIERHGNLFRGRVRIWALERRYYVSDLFTSTAKDRVYPVYQDQGGFFAGQLGVRRGDRVLDIGTGSGVLAIEASMTARETVGIDINPRAIEFARFNAELNDAPTVRFEAVALEDLSAQEPFDLVLCNPPFTAVPEPEAWYLHGSAGFDGLDVFRGFLRRLPGLVRPDGRLQLLLNSLGTDRDPQALALVRKRFPDAGLVVQHLYDPPTVAIAEYASRFAGSPAYAGWRAWLDERGFTHVYRMLITIDQAQRGRFEEQTNPGFRYEVIERFGAAPELASDAELGGWPEMLLRYGSRTHIAAS